MKRNAGAIIVVLLAFCAGQRLAGQEKPSPASSALHVSAEDLLTSPVGENWPSYNGDYTGRRFSSLREIDKANVGQLRAAWVFHPGQFSKAGSHSRGNSRRHVRDFRK